MAAAGWASALLAAVRSRRPAGFFPSLGSRLHATLRFHLRGELELVVFTRCESGDFPGPSVWYPLPRRGGQGGSLCAVDPITQPASVICFFLPTFRCGAGVGWATRWQSLGPLARVSHDSTRDLGWLEEDEHGWLSLLLGIRRGSWRVMVDTYLTWLCLRPWPFHPGALHFSICCPNAQQVVWRALVSPVHVHLRMDCRYLRLSLFFTVVNALPIIIPCNE